MVSFNDIRQMKDGKWLVKGICFEGDELPQSLNEEIACGSEIKEVDTGKTYFYFRYEWSHNGSTTSLLSVWINKDLLDFSGGQYKYIYPTSIEELRQLSETENNIWVFTGIKYSNKLLPNFTPQVADFNGTPWYQQAFGNIILCIPHINDIMYWTVTYYNIRGDEGENTFINSETVEQGMCPSNVPSGYDGWTDENGDPIDPWNVNIYFDRGFYGYPEEEEEEEIPYRYPIDANDYLYNIYNGESSDETTAETEMFIPNGAQFVGWNLAEEGNQYHKPIIDSGYAYLYYYPTSGDEYDEVEGWTGLEYTYSAPVDVEIYMPPNIYIPGGYHLSDWNHEEEGNPIPHYIPIYEQNDPNPGDPEEPGEPEEYYIYRFINDAEDSAQVPNQYSTYLGSQNGADDAHINIPQLDRWYFSNWVDGGDDTKFARYEKDSEYPVYYFINDSEDTTQVPNDNLTYLGYVVGSDGEEVNWGESMASANSPGGWIFGDWAHSEGENNYYARYIESILNGSTLNEGSNEITLQSNVTTRYDFTPSSSGTYRISSDFMPRDVRCALRNSESEEEITSADDIDEGDFDFNFDCILEADTTYFLDIFLYPGEGEDYSSATGSISIVYDDAPNYIIYNYDANDPLDFSPFIPESGEGEGPVCWEWVDSDGIWHIATDTSNINVDYDTNFYGFYCNDLNSTFSVKYTDDTREDPIIAEYNNIPAGTIIGTTYYPFNEEGEWEGPRPTGGFVSGIQIKNIPVYRNYSFEEPGP